MPELAKKVTVDLASKKLFLDGVEFPYYLSEEGPKVDGLLSRNELRSVTITFFTEDLEVIPEGTSAKTSAA